MRSFSPFSSACVLATIIQSRAGEAVCDLFCSVRPFFGETVRNVFEMRLDDDSAQRTAFDGLFAPARLISDQRRSVDVLG